MVLVDQSLTLKAIAVKAGMAASNVAASSYTLRIPDLRFLPPAGTYPTPQRISVLSSVPAVTIRYTVDGTTPTESSTLYTGEVAIDATTTLRASAWRTGWVSTSSGSNFYTPSHRRSSWPPCSRSEDREVKIP